jgi:hypothetical protein
MPNQRAAAKRSHERSRKYGARLGRLEFAEVDEHWEAIFDGAADAWEGWNELEWSEFQQSLVVGPPVEIPYRQLIHNGPVFPGTRTGEGLFTVLILVRAHALLHRANRTNEDGVVKATLGDYRAVYELLWGVLRPGAAALPREVRELFELVEKISGRSGGAVSEPVLARSLGLPKPELHRRIEQAIELGYLRDLEDRPGWPSHLVPAGRYVLPEPDEIETAARSRPVRKHRRPEDRHILAKPEETDEEPPPRPVRKKKRRAG